MTKDYYQILGVLDDAEDIVIKAAYKALAQRYHPDKWDGNIDDATRRMSDINEAYGLLSDPEKRKQYDKDRDQHSYNAEPDNDDLNTSVESDWQKVIIFFPDLIEITKKLSKISKSLEFSYKLILLEHKEFNRRKGLADLIEHNFLVKYFGTDQKIINFAKDLIERGHKKAAKDVNDAVTLLGSDVNSDVIIKKIALKWNIGRYDSKFKLAQIVLDSNSFFKSADLIEMMGGEVSGPDVKSNKYTVENKTKKHILMKDEVIAFARTLAYEILRDPSN